MTKAVTVALDAKLYSKLRRAAGRRSMSKFLDSLVPPRPSKRELAEGYKLMAQDAEREAEAMEWGEATIGDVADETR